MYQDPVPSNSPPAGGWEITPTPVIRLRTKNEYVTEYNPRTNVIFDNHHEYGYDEAGACFDICERGEDRRYVKNPNDQYTMRLKDPEEIVISIKTNRMINTLDISEEVEFNLGDKAVILMDFITFDKNMRLTTRTPMIDGWCFEIKYFNYDLPRPVKRRKISS
jgi:hypothetical protein